MIQRAYSPASFSCHSRRHPSRPYTTAWTRLGSAPNPTSSAIGSGIGIAGTIAASTLAIPVIGPIASGLALLVGALGIGGGCGQTCVSASNAVQQWAPQMTALGNQWQAWMQAQGGCLTSAQQQQLLTTFNQLWQWLVQQCTAVGGQGGQQCISDRQRGGKADVFAQYYDPISNTPICQSSSLLPVSGSTATGSTATGSQADWLPLLVPAGLLALAAVMS